MGYKNHLYICQHCGVAQATSSSTPPRECAVCEGTNFSPYPAPRVRARSLIG